MTLFHARWRLASAFDGLSAPGFSDQIRDGYSAAFEVFLAYTAHEQLAKALGMGHSEIPLDRDPELAAEIRTHLRDFEALLTKGARGKQRDGLREFWSGGTDDVRFIAYGIRNEVAHGPFTASRLKTKRSHAVLGRLAKEVLLVDELLFSAWLDERLAIAGGVV